MEAHLATLFESIADAVPDRPALTHGSVTKTWSELDDRGARVAAALTAAGLRASSKAALYLYNGPEYLEAQLGILKARCVPVNVNYRYRDLELVHLLDNSDAEALFFHSSLAERVERVARQLGAATLLVQVDDDGGPLLDGAVAYDRLLADHVPMPRIVRSPDDVFMLYTGGTTGLPKGVMFSLGSWTTSFVAGALAQLDRQPPASLDEVAGIVAALPAEQRIVTAPCAPLMHGTGLTLGALVPQTLGAEVVTLPSRSFDAHELLAAVERRGITNLAIVGDVFSKPILRALDDGAEGGRPYEVGSLQRIYSSGAMWSAEVKQQLLDRLPEVSLFDIMNSTEGAMATQVASRENAPTTATFLLNPETKVFTEDGREVVPGSEEIGMIAASGNVPLGYYKDAEKTARTFREIDGVRYSFPGDMARVASDGSLVLLGRGNQVINTGGEKVFPEEVEEAVKRVAGVTDCLVVGVDDERFGQAVTAVVQVEPDTQLSAADVVGAVKSELAGYKAPRHVVFVPVVPRAPNGKADHARAREAALAALGTA